MSRNMNHHNSPIAQPARTRYKSGEIELRSLELLPKLSSPFIVHPLLVQDHAITAGYSGERRGLGGEMQ
jgi:hypothetical protein